MFLLAAVLPIASLLSGAQQSPRPFVIAHYMHTYVLGAAKPTDPPVANSERLNHMDKGAPKVEVSSYFPAKIAATAAGGAAATLEDFKEAKAAGVDAFALLISKGYFPHSQFTAALNLLASVAQTQDTKIIPDVWADPWQDDYKELGLSMRAFMDAHPGAFAVRDGKPMFSLYFSNATKHYSSPTDQQMLLTSIQKFLEPWGGFAATYTMAYTFHTL